MKEFAYSVLGAVVFGFIAMSGMRAAEWIIPKPEARVVFCVYRADDTVEDMPATCRTLEQWIKEGRVGK